MVLKVVNMKISWQFALKKSTHHFVLIVSQFKLHQNNLDKEFYW